MIFKKIEMIGFKSFADRTIIEFGDNFTAIVGPNGCGKSNVSDAIRWVLGEQSPKTLRGDSMQDFIFNGTEKRKSLSYCEVTLTFDNSERFFNFDYDELAITRKLYRSGESEYLINRNTCRLKDITNLLYNSGLGKNGYSVVSQGKVTELVDSKPENRRAMFEDAAGISKYKNDKKEAENKLERTNDNLTRVRDILSEIERQMGPLKKQAENAKKYLEFKGELKDLEVNAYIYQFEHANDEKEKINIKLDAINRQLTQRECDLDQANENYDKAMSELSNFDKLLSSLNEKILELTIGLEKQESETKLARERVNFTLKENDRLNLEITNSNTALQIAEEEREKTENKLKDLKEGLDALEASFDELSNHYLLIANELALSEDEAGQGQQKVIETLGSLSDIKSSVSRLMAEKEILSTNLASLQNDIDTLSVKKNESDSNYKEIEQSVENKESKLKFIKTQIEDLTSKNYLAEREIKDLETERANTTTQIKVFENRKKLLTDLQNEYDGYSYAVKKLLKESNRNPQIKKNIIGVVASLIKVPQKFETAIEVALGGALQNIVTHNEDGAKELINFLKQNSFGRATFLPVSSMKRRDIDECLVAGKTGCYGVASKLVDYDKTIDNVVSNLLGSTVIAETIDIAIALAKETRYAFRIVTLDGEIVTPQGSLTGGSKKAESSNIMGREREIETLGMDIAKLEDRAVEIEKQISEEQKLYEENKHNLTSLNVESNAIEVEIASEREKLNRYSALLVESTENLKVAEMEMTTVTNKIKLIDEELGRSEKIQSALSGNKVDADELIKEHKEKFEKLRKERDDINNNILAVKVEIAEAKTKINALNEDLNRINNEIGKQNTNIFNAQEMLNKNQEFIDSCEQMIKNKLASAPSTAKKQELEGYIAKRSKAQQDKFSIQEKIKEFDADKSNLMTEISSIKDKKFREEMNLSKVDTELEQMQERIYEEYSLSYTTCLEYRKADFDINIAMPQIGKLKKDINALGYVNVNAIEDCKVLLERYDDLNGQAQDLESAQEDLLKIIKDLSGIMIEKFNNELARINESFKLTFRELFGGGFAKLALSDENNPLESGVEIYAQPPGKKIQNMTLLSGGEKSLTAMAVIFAILRIKPLPFCLFDEVEAALDDSNVEIVDKYLKKLSNETQFILITHKKPTMEYANALFGVTMEEKGVSKIVSVLLSDAIKHAQEA
ncbi:MAG: chromosome segregation protein SMC [Clostridiales bacterium]|nr:chromosome segregation protein SMC [Clostridiales bacterium]